MKKENEARREEELKNKKLIESIPNLHDQIENLKKALNRKEEELKRFEEDSEILKDLHKQGYLMKEIQSLETKVMQMLLESNL